MCTLMYLMVEAEGDQLRMIEGIKFCKLCKNTLDLLNHVFRCEKCLVEEAIADGTVLFKKQIEIEKEELGGGSAFSSVSNKCLDTLYRRKKTYCGTCETVTEVSMITNDTDLSYSEICVSCFNPV